MNRVLVLSALFVLAAVPLAMPTASAVPQIVGVCVKGTTSPSCYGGHDVCIGVSEEVPFCQDVPATITTCGNLCGLDPVQVCSGSDPCAGGHTFCVVISTANPWILLSEPRPICGDCECIPAFAPVDPRAFAIATIADLP